MRSKCSNAASFFASGLKGRAKEEQFEEHTALTGTYGMDVVKDGRLQREDVPLRNAGRTSSIRSR